MNSKLGGYLVGFAIKRKNGEFRKVLFDRPVHNTITKHCLNNLLTFDGTNAEASSNQVGNTASLFFKFNGTSDRYGVFNSCALGDGTGDTSVNDSDLKHRVSAQTTTRKTGSGWCGTTVDSANACIKLRVSHQHSIESDFTIREIGWYNAILRDGLLNYTLSSRVVLDDPVDVVSGDTFFTIYEIEIDFQGVERFSDFGGLGPGYSVNAGMFVSSEFFGYTLLLPLVNENGMSFIPNNDYSMDYVPGMRPPWCPLAAFGGYYGGSQRLSPFYAIKTNIDKTKPFLVNTHLPQENFGEILYSIKPYSVDTFRRDFSLTVGATHFGSGIYALAINGTLYRFGTFDENDAFTPSPVTISSPVRFTIRQSWRTDLLTPAA